MAVEVASVGGAANLQSRSVTPSSLPYTVYPQSGYDGMSSVTFGKDANLISSNIKKNVSIFGVSGSYQGEKTLDSSMATIDSGKIKVIVPNLLQTHTIKNLAINLSYSDDFGDSGSLYSAFAETGFYAVGENFGTELIYPKNGYFFIEAPNGRNFTQVNGYGAKITVL